MERRKREKVIWRVLSSALVVSMAGCAGGGWAVGPDYEEPEIQTPANYRYESRKNGKPAARRDGWWGVFGDRGLDRLISQVRAGNHELKAGVRRIEQSRALVRGAGAGLMPQVAGGASARRARVSDAVPGSGTSSLFSAPLSVDWEIDLFGRIRRGQEAAGADAQAVEEDQQALLLALESEAAAGYFTLRAIDREIQLVEEGVASRKSSLDLAKDRLDLGAVSGLDVSQASALLATSEADLEGLRRQRAAQETALAVLAGQAASTFSISANPLSGGPPSVPAGLPSELLRARPDIRRAERRLAAENARVGVAVAAFYPSISVTGNFGTQASDVSRIFDRGARFWGIGPDIYVPIFQGGRNQAELDRSRARYEEVLENYQQAVVESIAEVETALAATRFFTRQTAAQKRAVEAAREARDIALNQYQGGTSSYINVLDAERTTLDAERQLSLVRGAEFVNTVNLIRSLGGRW